ncbi:hypothetical protein BCA37_11825 [Mycobacterium sp. djl-10]|nr:hypothetical protein BCA37_11825 [Mycobacterium sp. djl-10]
MYDYAGLSEARSWRETAMVTEDSAPHGFMRYYRREVAAALIGSPPHWQATQYLMGNPLIDDGLFQHDPSVMLHNPLRALIYADAGGVTQFCVDQPGQQLASYDNAQISTAGESARKTPISRKKGMASGSDSITVTISPTSAEVVNDHTYSNPSRRSPARDHLPVIGSRTA